MNPPAQRLLSLDVFRGGTIAAMIMVNNLGSFETAYAPLMHAEWHGWTFTDLVFPFFLWIVGVATTLSFAKRIERGDDRGKLLLHVGKRAAAIFLIGLFLNGFPRFNLETIRIPGVLQRIAVCYLIAAALYLFFGTRARITWAAALLALYWVLMMTVPVPGCGAGSFEVDCNFVRYIDSMFLYGHMYSQTKTWDPEGIVSTIPAIVTVLLGIFAGEILRRQDSNERKAGWLFFAGACLLFLGLMLSNWMPINKKIWTVSYTLFTGGMASIVFACCMWLIDVAGWRRYARPFVIYGVNALAVYVLSGVFARLIGIVQFAGMPLRSWLWRNGFQPFYSPQNASLVFALAHVALFWVIAWFMYRRNWIVRV